LETCFGYFKEQTKMHQHTQQNNVDIKNIFSSLLNQRHVTFQPSLYAYSSVHMCNWDAKEAGQFLNENPSVLS